MYVERSQKYENCHYKGEVSKKDDRSHWNGTFQICTLSAEGPLPLLPTMLILLVPKIWHPTFSPTSMTSNMQPFIIWPSYFLLHLQWCYSSFPSTQTSDSTLMQTPTVRRTTWSNPNTSIVSLFFPYHPLPLWCQWSMPHLWCWMQHDPKDTLLSTPT